MKKLLLIVLIPALSFMVSCGGSDDDGFMSQMKKMKEVADNAKEMQEEMEANPEEQDVIFKESLLKQMDLKATGQSVPDEVWDRVQTTTDDFLALDSATVADMNSESLNTFFVDHGYANTDAAYEELEQIGKLAEFTLGAAVHVAAMMQTRLIDGKEGYDKAVKEFADELNEKGYSADDLRLFEKNAKLEANAMAVRMASEVIANKKEIIEAIDSTQAVLDAAETEVTE